MNASPPENLNRSAPMLFDSFAEGGLIGTMEARVDAPVLEGWQRLYSRPVQSLDRLPRAIVTALIMRAYMNVITPRPPGNIHVRNKLVLVDSPCFDEAIRIAFSCTRKEIRKGRRYIDIAARGSGSEGRPLFAAAMTMIWAA